VINLWPDGCPGEGAGCVSAISSSDGCSWTLHKSGAGADIIAVAQNCSPCSSCTVTFTFTGSQVMPQASFRLFDVANAATSSFQNDAGGNGACGTTLNNAPSITPSGGSSGLSLVIAEMYNGTGPVTGFATGAPSGAVFDLWTFTGQTDSDLADNADALAHYYFSGTSAQNWNWTKTNGSDVCAWAAAIFN